MEAVLAIPSGGSVHPAAAQGHGNHLTGAAAGGMPALPSAQQQQASSSGAVPAAGEEGAPGEPAKKRQRRRRKGPAGDINVALYIKQQQARGSTRHWRQQWVSVRTIIGGGEVRMLKWVSDTPPAAPTESIPGFANFQGFAQSSRRKDKSAAATAADASKADTAAAKDAAAEAAAVTAEKAGGAKGPVLHNDSAAAATFLAPGSKNGASLSGFANALPPSSHKSGSVKAASGNRASGGSGHKASSSTKGLKPLTAAELASFSAAAAAALPVDILPVMPKPLAAVPPPSAAVPVPANAAAAAAPRDIKSIAASIAAAVAEAAGSDAGAAGAAAAGGTKKRGRPKKDPAPASSLVAAEGEGGGEPIVTGPPGAERYACPTCGKDYSSLGSLRKHMHSHVAKTFECTHPGCAKKFADAQKLARHAVKHTASQGLKCDACGKCFFTVFNLRTHWKQLHKDIPMPSSLMSKPGAVAGSATDL